MHEFLALAALITFVATGVGLLIAGVAHCALATDPLHRRKSAPGLPRDPVSSGRRRATD